MNREHPVNSRGRDPAFLLVTAFEDPLVDQLFALIRYRCQDGHPCRDTIADLADTLGENPRSIRRGLKRLQDRKAVREGKSPGTNSGRSLHVVARFAQRLDERRERRIQGQKKGSKRLGLPFYSIPREAFRHPFTACQRALWGLLLQQWIRNFQTMEPEVTVADRQGNLMGVGPKPYWLTTLQLAQEIGVNESTAKRNLLAMEEEGYVYAGEKKDPKRRMHIKTRWASIPGLDLNRWDHLAQFLIQIDRAGLLLNQETFPADTAEGSGKQTPHVVASKTRGGGKQPPRQPNEIKGSSGGGDNMPRSGVTNCPNRGGQIAPTYSSTISSTPPPQRSKTTISPDGVQVPEAPPPDPPREIVRFTRGEEEAQEIHTVLTRFGVHRNGYLPRRADFARILSQRGWTPDQVYREGIDCEKIDPSNPGALLNYRLCQDPKCLAKGVKSPEQVFTRRGEKPHGPDIPRQQKATQTVSYDHKPADPKAIGNLLPGFLQAQ